MNYVVVEARGKLRFVDDKAWLRAQVEALTAQQESTFAEPWAVSDAPADYVEKDARRDCRRGDDDHLDQRQVEAQPEPARAESPWRRGGLNGVGSEAARPWRR